MPRPSISEAPPPPAGPADLQDRLQRHVEALAGRIGERHVWRPDALRRAEAYVRRELESFGYAVRGLEFDAPIPGGPVTVRNLEAELEGGALRGEVPVIGAHYDSVPGTPGADDNASGTAVLLEAARALRGDRPSRTVRFTAFANEEPPFFRTPHMGSRLYALPAREAGERIAGMVSLEMFGFYSEEAGSQDYPFPLSFFYPSRGDFLAVVSNLPSRPFLGEVVRTFRTSTDFPSESLSAPSWVRGSDGRTTSPSGPRATLRSGSPTRRSFGIRTTTRRATGRTPWTTIVWPAPPPV